MEVIATQKFIHMSPRKVRLVTDSIRGKSIQQALIALQFMTKRAAEPVEKTIKSAQANAINNSNLNKDTLRVKTIEINEGPRLKRFRPASRGVAHGYKRRMSHIKVVLEGEI